MPVPKIMLCADDFAVSPGTSRVIAELARARRINGISCMAAAPSWHQDALLLEGIECVECGTLGRIQVGLHLVLTSLNPIGELSCTDAEGRMPGADRLLMLALAGRIDAHEFETEIDRQFAAFKFARGYEPDFVDGHQHVHVYPVIRELVIAAVRRHAPRAWIRVPSDRCSAMITRPFPGKAMASAVHALGFRETVVQNGLQANASFAGHYDFADGYEDYLPKFFTRASNAHLIMCHPGAGDDKNDAIGPARVIEADAIGTMPLELRLEFIRAGAQR